MVGNDGLGAGLLGATDKEKSEQRAGACLHGDLRSLATIGPEGPDDKGRASPGVTALTRGR